MTPREPPLAWPRLSGGALLAELSLPTLLLSGHQTCIWSEAECLLVCWSAIQTLFLVKRPFKSFVHFLLGCLFLCSRVLRALYI